MEITREELGRAAAVMERVAAQARHEDPDVQETFGELTSPEQLSKLAAQLRRLGELRPGEGPRATTQTSDGRTVPVTHECSAKGAEPCEEHEHYVIVKRRITIEEQVAVDVPEGEHPDEYALEIVEGAEHWQFGEEWTRDAPTEPGQIVSYQTEIGSY